jgi:hypothetical protein
MSCEVISNRKFYVGFCNLVTENSPQDSMLTHMTAVISITLMSYNSKLNGA